MRNVEKTSEILRWLLCFAFVIANCYANQLAVANHIGRGFDLTGRMGIQYAKDPVVEHDWSKVVSVSRNGVTATIPDTMFLQDIRQSKTTTNDYTSIEQLQESMSVWGACNFNFLIFAVEASVRWTHFTQTELTKSTSEQAVFLYMYYLGLGATDKDLKLTPEFQAMVDRLPARWSDNTAAYDAIIRRFGTHYISGAHFGASFTRSVAYNKKFEKSNSDTHIKIRGGIDFFFFKIMITLYEENFHSESQSMSEVMRAKLTNEGGSTIGILAEDPSAPVKWLQSLADMLVALDFSYRPLSDLIADKSKAQGMATAIAVHIARSNLGQSNNDVLVTDSMKVQNCRQLDGVAVQPGSSHWRNRNSLRAGQCLVLVHSYDDRDALEVIVTPVPGNPAFFTKVVVNKNEIVIRDAGDVVLDRKPLPQPYVASVFHILKICLGKNPTQERAVIVASIFHRTDLNTDAVSALITSSSDENDFSKFGGTVQVSATLSRQLSEVAFHYFALRGPASNKRVAQITFLQRCVVPGGDTKFIEEEKAVEYTHEIASDRFEQKFGSSSFIETSTETAQQHRAQLKAKLGESEFNMRVRDVQSLFGFSVEKALASMEVTVEDSETFLLPGYSLLGMGFDVGKTSGPESATGTVIVPPTRKVTVNVCGRDFQVPTHVAVTRVCYASASTSVFHNQEDFEGHTAIHASVGFGYKIFYGEISADLKLYNRGDTRRVIGKYQDDIVLCSMDLHDPVSYSYSTGFRRDLDRLPAFWEDDPIGYARFIQKWGTHYVKSVKLGGRLEMTQLSAYDDKFDSWELGGQAHLALRLGVIEFAGLTLGASGGRGEGLSINVTSSESKMLGGDPIIAAKVQVANPLSTKAMNYDPTATLVDWFRSAVQRPSAFDLQFGTLASLVDDPFKKRGLELAMSLHLTRQKPEDVVLVMPGQEVWSPFFLYSEDSCVSMKAAVADVDSLRFMLAAVPAKKDYRYEVRVNSRQAQLVAYQQSQADSTEPAALAVGQASLFGDFFVCYQNGLLQYGRNGKITLSVHINSAQSVYYFGFSGEGNKERYYVTSINLISRNEAFAN
eukprot:TRINITY_DN6535_c0_g1_i1.p1 TRINITY_DN6535_c0_g1~~TRINITY_DN6535_c0_g1_i1.p1  ORF type:complete len:1069 (+),score=256.89 TRINITY_DN6535_c0_g1_i1:66-3272(+)